MEPEEPKKQFRKGARLVEGSVWLTIVRLTIPMIWGVFAIVIFNLADTYFVARLGTLQLAAMSFTFPVVMTLGSIALGLGVGASSVISRAIGEGDHHKVQRLTTDSLTLSFSIVAVLIFIGMATIDPLFKAMGADPEVLTYIRQYMQIWYLGMFFVVIPMVGNNALRAHGDTLTPSIIMSISAGINIVLDPLLIFGLAGFPELGIRGAALATVFARMTSFIVTLSILHFRDRMLDFTRPRLKEVLSSWGGILHVGLPAAGTNMVVPASMGIITAILASFGPEVVAGFGVATRIEGFSIIVVAALSVSFAPFVGQNWGAGRYDRIQKGLKVGRLISLVWGVIIAVLLGIFAVPLVKLFNSHSVVVDIASAYLWIVPASYGAYGIIMLTSSMFNALGKPLPSVTLIVTRMVALYLPLAYLLKWLMGAYGVFLAATIANFAVGVIAYLWQRKKFPPELSAQTSEKA